jgi:hypothetical protein
MRALRYAVGLATIAAPAAAGSRVDAPQTLIQGVYELAEWHTDTSVLHTPLVLGRVVIEDGVFITIAAFVTRFGS